MDGFAEADSTAGNAITAQGTPYINYLKKTYPSTLLEASGFAVGLPEGQMGNSEVGHLNIGAGRVVFQELSRISKEIKDKEFFKNTALLEVMRSAKENGKALHTFGLLSDGGVHSHTSHLYALIEMAKNEGLDNIYIHCFMDGRDVSPVSGKGYIESLQNHIKAIGFGAIATVMGRFYPMDRDNRWERVEEAYSAMAFGNGAIITNAEDAFTISYENGITDEFIVPHVIITGEGKPVKLIEKGDSIIFFNFRPDRAREITRAFIEEKFTKFERKTGFLNPSFAGFTKYDETFQNIKTAFVAQSLSNNLNDILESNNIKQLRIAETEKYAHVTFFFNSGIEKPAKGEDRVLIPSPKVSTYDQKPEMSAYEVANEAVKLIKKNKYDFIVLNFANCDMVGHTGDFNSAVKAVETVDNCVKLVVEAVLEVGGNVLLTSDHGNAEKMLEPSGEVFTAHTTNKVPFILIPADCKLRDNGKLSDIAPTILELMRIDKPSEMTAESLICKA